MVIILLSLIFGSCAGTIIIMYLNRNKNSGITIDDLGKFLKQHRKRKNLRRLNKNIIMQKLKISGKQYRKLINRLKREKKKEK